MRGGETPPFGGGGGGEGDKLPPPSTLPILARGFFFSLFSQRSPRSRREALFSLPPHVIARTFFPCHCEERSDEAICRQNPAPHVLCRLLSRHSGRVAQPMRLPRRRFAAPRNDMRQRAMGSLPHVIPSGAVQRIAESKNRLHDRFAGAVMAAWRPALPHRRRLGQGSYPDATHVPLAGWTVPGRASAPVSTSRAVTAPASAGLQPTIVCREKPSHSDAGWGPFTRLARPG